MGYPYPKAPLEDGTGTTPLDLQRIIGAQYVASGLLPDGGGTVSGTSSMSYAVEAGVAFMWTSYAARLGMLVPFEATTVATDPAPATGSRTDTVYVDGDGSVRVAIGSTSAPAGGIALARWTVPAGITATMNAAQRLDRDYAIHTGTSLGRWSHWNHPGGVLPVTTTVHHQSQFHLPSDRRVRLDLTTTLRSTGGAHVGLTAAIDGPDGPVLARALSCPVGSDWQTFGASSTFALREGVHTIRVSTAINSGSMAETATGASVTEMSLEDMVASR